MKFVIEKEKTVTVSVKYVKDPLDEYLEIPHLFYDHISVGYFVKGTFRKNFLTNNEKEYLMSLGVGVMVSSEVFGSKPIWYIEVE